MSIAKKGTDIVKNLGKDFLNKQIDKFNKEYITGKGSRITLKNSEIKLIKSLENGDHLLKETTRKITSETGEFLNFLRPLMTAGLPLIKSVLTPLARLLALLPFRLSAAMSAPDALT